MYFYAHHRAVVALALAVALLSGCSSVSYQTEEWRVAVPEQGDARAVVRYIGIGTNSKDPAAREQMAEKLKALAEEKNPTKGFAPTLQNVRRRVYMEGDKLVLEETGTLPNPLSWQQQSGLNPLGWFSSGPALITQGDHILKRDLDSNRNVLASDGKIMDEDTYTHGLRDKKPIGISTDTTWQRPSEQPVPDEMTLQEAEVIVWPRQARTFYWKVSGKGFKQSWQSLVPEYENVAAVETVVPGTVTRSATNAPAVTEEVITLDELTAPPVTEDTAPIRGVEQDEAGNSATTNAVPATEPVAAVTDKADQTGAGAEVAEQPVAPKVATPAPVTPKAASAATEPVPAATEPAPAAKVAPAAPVREEDFPDETPVTPVSADDTIK